MSTYAPLPDFTPAQPLRVCEVCGNPGHSTDNHPLLEVLNRQTELLAVLAGVLEPKRYRLSAEAQEDGNGRATVWFENWPGGVGKLWLVERSMVYTDSTAGNLNVGMYIVDSLPRVTYQAGTGVPVVPALNPRDLSDYSNLAIAAQDNAHSPALVKGSEKVVFQWSGLSGGARVMARVQLRHCWQAID